MLVLIWNRNIDMGHQKTHDIHVNRERKAKVQLECSPS